MNYDAMTDRELDALVAERVMGLVDVRSFPKDGHWRGELKHTVNAGPKHRVEVPYYTRAIQDAFSVVKAMRERGWFFSCRTTAESASAAFILEQEGHAPKVAEEFADSIPRAICLAALRALDGL